MPFTSGMVVFWRGQTDLVQDRLSPARARFLRCAAISPSNQAVEKDIWSTAIAFVHAVASSGSPWLTDGVRDRSFNEAQVGWQANQAIHGGA